MHAKYEVSTSSGSKVIAKVKVDNRQTDKQTNRQDKNNMPLIIRSGGIKKYERAIIKRVPTINKKANLYLTLTLAMLKVEVKGKGCNG